MHIEKVSYQKTFNLGNYSSERIGVEFVLHQGESADKALETARQLVHEYYEKYQVKVNPDYAYLLNGTDSEPSVYVDKEEKTTPKTVVDNAKSFIDSCNSIEELKAWELMSNTNPDLKKYYNKKLKTLTND
jgi:hypothetical protein